MVAGLSGILDKRCACDTQSRALGKSADEEFVIIRRQGNVGVEITDEIELNCLQLLITGCEASGLGRELPIPVLWHPDELNPCVLGGISLNDGVRAISGAVAYDNPP